MKHHSVVSTLGRLLVAFGILLTLSTCASRRFENSDRHPIVSGLDWKLDKYENIESTLKSIDEFESRIDELEIDSLERELLQALKYEIQNANFDKSVLDIPEGKDNELLDLSIGQNNDSWVITWSYKNVGDYDLNGEVNAADIVPIAKYYKATNEVANWSKAGLADGDNNGEVNGADVVPIARHFFSQVAGYNIYGRESELASWQFVGSTTLSDANFEISPPRFEFVFNDSENNFFLCAPHDSKGYDGVEHSKDDGQPAIWNKPNPSTNGNLVSHTPGPTSFNGKWQIDFRITQIAEDNQPSLLNMAVLWDGTVVTLTNHSDDHNYLTAVREGANAESAEVIDRVDLGQVWWGRELFVTDRSGLIFVNTDRRINPSDDEFCNVGVFAFSGEKFQLIHESPEIEDVFEDLDDICFVSSYANELIATDHFNEMRAYSSDSEMKLLWEADFDESDFDSFDIDRERIIEDDLGRIYFKCGNWIVSCTRVPGMLKLEWAFELPVQFGAKWSIGPILSNDGRIIAASDTGHLFYWKNTGELLWRTDMAKQGDDARPEQLTFIQGNKACIWGYNDSLGDEFIGANGLSVYSISDSGANLLQFLDEDDVFQSDAWVLGLDRPMVLDSLQRLYIFVTQDRTDSDYPTAVLQTASGVVEPDRISTLRPGEYVFTKNGTIVLWFYDIGLAGIN